MIKIKSGQKKGHVGANIFGVLMLQHQGVAQKVICLLTQKGS
jgi:hypothetical protein